MDLSVIIVSYNSREELRRSIAAVELGAKDLSWEIIVVDNASGDDSVGYVGTTFPEVKLVRNTHNHGFARACNQGVAVSAGDFVLFLNPDTECKPGSLTSLVRVLQNDRAIGTVGPRLLAEDGRPSRSCFRFHTLWRPTFNLPLLRWIVGERLALHYSPEHPSIRGGGPVDWLSGACLLVRRNALEQVGGFDERYFMYFDDTDLCNRLVTEGWGVVYVPAVEVVHHGAQSSKKSWGRMLVEMQRSRLIYLSKHYGAVGQLVLRALMVAAAVLRVVPSICAGKRNRIRTEIDIIRVALTAVE